MSHEMSTVLVSCGLMVGLNIAPPPPGPITRKLPGRSPQAVVNKIAKAKPGDDHLQFHGQSHGCFERKRPPVRFLLASGSRFTNSLVPRLESDSKPQPDGPAAVDTLLGEC